MTRQKQTAITNLYSQVVLIRGDDCFDDDGNPVSVNQSRVDEEVARLQAEYDSKAYARARAKAYPSIENQLDMQYHDQTEGSRTWLDAIESVKEAHPK